tara:strand:- start:573 stop:788 length:216 start_codon:yes stop_codon:yes gene_type:complete
LAVSNSEGADDSESESNRSSNRVGSPDQESNTEIAEGQQMSEVFSVLSSSVDAENTVRNTSSKQDEEESDA